MHGMKNLKFIFKVIGMSTDLGESWVPP